MSKAVISKYLDGNFERPSNFESNNEWYKYIISELDLTTKKGAPQSARYVALAIQRLQGVNPKKKKKKFNGTKVEFEETDTKAKFTYEGLERVTTLKQAVKFHDIDLDKWSVLRQRVGNSEVSAKQADGGFATVTNYNFSAEFAPKKAALDLDKLAERLKKYKPPKFKAKYKNHNQTAAVLNQYDAHLDKVCLITETGTESDIHQNIEIFDKYFDELLSDIATYKPEKIFLPTGNDLFNTNGAAAATKKGTQQARFINHHDSYEMIGELIIKCIHKALQVAPVECIMVKGNHDEDNVHKLGIGLNWAFRGVSDFSINYTRRQRKYFQYGANMIAFAHGDKEAGKVKSLPSWLMAEEPQMVADTQHRYMYMGDKHHLMEYVFLRTKDLPVLTAKFLRSCGTDDAWHNDHGWIGVPRSCEADIWDYDKGVINSFQKIIR